MQDGVVPFVPIRTYNNTYSSVQSAVSVVVQKPIIKLEWEIIHEYQRRQPHKQQPVHTLHRLHTRVCVLAIVTISASKL